MRKRGTLVALGVEDDDLARQRLEVYCNSRGLRLDSAPDSLTAIEKLQKSAYVLVFLDLDLGAGSTLEGEGVLAWMDRHGKYIPTVVISESAPFPAVIRLEQAYHRFVKLRMMHADLDHLSDLVDEILKATTIRHAGASDRAISPAALILLVTVLILLVAFAAIATKVSPIMFTPVVGAAILTFVVLIVAALMFVGLLSEKGFVKIIAEVMRKIPKIGVK